MTEEEIEKTLKEVREWNKKNQPECLACGDCCRDFRIVFPFELHPYDLELFQVRGFTIVNRKTIQLKPYICPQLDDATNKCLLHGPFKPVRCREFFCKKVKVGKI